MLKDEGLEPSVQVKQATETVYWKGKRPPEDTLDIEQRELIQTATNVLYDTSLLMLHATFEGESTTRTKYRMMRHIAGLPVEEKERKLYKPTYIDIPERVKLERPTAQTPSHTFETEESKKDVFVDALTDMIATEPHPS
ncbi:hypothetical protein BC829DRAFT_400769 [Chytridium lagenaria]|nr:hypothetical protein BC829DRAFT_400769 [Chytridium lagenaria]